MSNGEGNMRRCEGGHLFSVRKYGTVCPYCQRETETKERKETGIREADIEELLLLDEVQPVCAWVVCIEGPRRGKDYKVREGKNFIGRADDMQIQILGDNKINRRNHAVIVFDSKKKETTLLPGDSTGLVYLNDDNVLTPRVLNAYDLIELGESKFLFIPFCGEHYMWEDDKSGVPANA